MKIWDTFTDVATECCKHEGKIAIEWPQNCAYWKFPQVDDFIEQHGLKKVHIHGCALGLVDGHGNPIKKAWTIATNDHYLLQGLNGKLCPGKHVHLVHTKCEGKYTKMTEEYTFELTDIIHKQWKRSVRHSKEGDHPSAMSPELANLCGYYDPLPVGGYP